MRDAETELEIGQVLPPWRLQPVGGDGEVPGPGAFCGRPLLLLFFSLRCVGSTARAVPFANRIVVERAAVQVLGILTDDADAVRDEDVQAEAERLHIRFPVYRDAGLSATAHAYRTGGTPHWVLVRPSGTVAESLFGSEPNQTLLRLGYRLDEWAGLSVVGLGGGCHWCTEAVFESLRGVERVEQGWARSDPPNDAWSEAVVVYFRTTEIGLETLLEAHLLTHASTSRHAMREKYRSAVYAVDPEQQDEARGLLAALAEENGAPYVTEALRLRGFRLNEPRYLGYYRTRPNAPFCRTYIHPKLRTIRERFGAQSRDAARLPFPPLAAPQATPVLAPGRAPDVLTWRDVIGRVNHGNPPAPRRVEQTDAEWRAALPEEVYRVARRGATERRHSSGWCERFEPGRYACRCCGSALFDSAHQVGGSGWPTFVQPAVDAHVAYRKEGPRVAATCNVCDAHLGHVTPDGPSPGGLRYCINGASLAAGPESASRGG